VIKVWNTENHSVKFTLDANFAGDGVKKKKILPSPVTALAFNGKDMLLSATKDGRVICWDLSEAKEKVVGM
jgi:WD40 repeat protein